MMPWSMSKTFCAGLPRTAGGQTAAAPRCDRAGEPGGPLRRVLRHHGDHSGVLATVRDDRTRGTAFCAAAIAYVTSVLGKPAGLDHADTGVGLLPVRWTPCLGRGRVSVAHAEAGQPDNLGLGHRPTRPCLRHHRTCCHCGSMGRYPTAAHFSTALQREHPRHQLAVQPRHLANGIQLASGPLPSGC